MQNPNLQNARYVALHKLYVGLAGLKLGVSPWRLLKHDWTKLLPLEWSAYRDFFYGGKARSANSPAEQRKQVSPEVKDAFDRAWNSHQKTHSHHWQYYVLLKDDGTMKPLPMPDADVREMVADWIGAGRMWGGKVAVWYHNNMHRIILHDDTRREVERLIGVPVFASYFAHKREAAARAARYEQIAAAMKHVKTFV